MTEAIDPQLAWINELQGNSNRKFLFQNIIGSAKQDLELKTNRNTSIIFQNQRILEALEAIYDNRFINLCNETISFLYQLCKIAIRSRIAELKIHILSLTPRIIVLYFYFAANRSEKGSKDIDGLEILFGEIVQLDYDQFKYTEEEYLGLAKMLPDFANIVQNLNPNVYVKKMKSSLNSEETMQENTISRILGIFNSNIHLFSNTTIEDFFLLTEMVSGIKINLKELRLSNNAEYTKEFSLASDSFNKSKIIMKCIAGLETVKALKPKYKVRVSKGVDHLSLKAVNSGQFLAYNYGEAIHHTELKDVFD